MILLTSFVILVKEPKNYYTHRSKSMRRKAGGNDVSATGSGGGLQ
jgi:hypothetical protein